MRRVLALAACMAATFLQADERARTWTDTAGRTVTAEFLGQSEDGASVRIRRAGDGREFVLETERLSDADRKWLERRRNERTGGPAALAETAAAEWPRVVDIEGAIDVEVVREDRDADDFVYRTRHFEFHSDIQLSRSLVQGFGRIFETTYEAVQRLPLRLEPEPPARADRFQVRLFKTVEEYHTAGGFEGSGGMYSARRRTIFVPLPNLGVRESSSGFTEDENADNSTLVHELTHQLMHRWLAALPKWLVEGMAVYMESVPFERGRFEFDDFDLESHMEERWADLENLTVIDPETLFAVSSLDWNATMRNRPHNSGDLYRSSFLLTVFFLWDTEDGRGLAAYMHALAAGTPEAEARERHLMRGRSMDRLRTEWERELRREGAKAEFTRRY